MLLADITTFCNKSSNLLQFVGYAILIFKVAIPVIIIVLGMMDFGKAVVSEKDEDIKKQAVKLGRRALAGVIIFFIPTVVNWVFDGISSAGDSFNTCTECLFHPTQNTCTAAVKANKES